MSSKEITKIRFVDYVLHQIETTSLNLTVLPYRWFNGYSYIANDSFKLTFKRYWFSKNTVTLTRYAGHYTYSIPLTRGDESRLWDIEPFIESICDEQISKYEKERAAEIERMSWWP